MVSIITTLIIMVLLSLVVIGFARITRREQRQSLDRQLTTQAFYAAETGVNAAVKAIEAGYSGEKTNCAPDASGPLSSNALEPTGGISYPCLLIKRSPGDLIYDLQVDKSKVFKVRSASGSAITNITVSWDDNSGGSDFSGCPAVGSFPVASAWPSNCQAGLLRAELLPSDGLLTRSGLSTNTFTAFLYPRNNSGQPTIGFSAGQGYNGQGIIHPVVCNASGSAPKKCSVTINSLNSVEYTMRLKTIYRPASAVITASTGAGAAELAGSQVLVDSTGKANDVLRRIQVRVPIGNAEFPFPEFVLESAETVCKRLVVGPGFANTDPDPACQIN